MSTYAKRMDTDFDTLVSELEARCVAAALVARDEFHDGDDTFPAQDYGWSITDPQRPNRSARLNNLGTGGEEALRFTLATKFEHSRYLEEYDGVWSKEGVVEAEVRFGQQWAASDPIKFISKRQGRLRGEGPETESPNIVSVPTVSETTQVEFGYASKEFLVWITASPTIRLVSLTERIPVVRIRSSQITSREAALDFLNRYGLASLMALDTSLNITAQLVVPQPFLFRYREHSETAIQRLTECPQPTPTLLFLHARAERQNPVARFLSFYHVLEFFFPRLSYAAKAAELKKLSEPLLQELSTERIVAILKATNKRGVGNESEQLTHTIEHAVTEHELREFLCSDRDLRTFYDCPKSQMRLVEIRVPICDIKEHLRRSLARRLYAIRNRIVHKKEPNDDRSEDNGLLPFSSEVAYLHEDVIVIEYIARRLLEKQATLLE
jgi:hypothetical protein